MSAGSEIPLAEAIAKLYVRCCNEREMESAELLLQALESLARRHGDDTVLEAAILETLVALAGRDLH